MPHAIPSVKAAILYKKFSYYLLPNFFFFQKDFLWTMDRDKNGHDGLNGQEWTAEWTMDNGQWTMDNGQWTMDNGQWTMDNGQWTEIMYLSGLIPTSPIRLIRRRNQ